MSSFPLLSTKKSVVPRFSSGRVSARHVRKIRKLSCLAQGGLYILASLFHFVTDAELAIIPPSLPLRRTALYVTGVFELLGGVGLLIPRLQRPASWGLAALLVAIWPANIYHALSDRRRGRWKKSAPYHIVRFPLQIILIAWVLWSGADTSEERP